MLFDISFEHNFEQPIDIDKIYNGFLSGELMTHIYDNVNVDEWNNDIRKLKCVWSLEQYPIIIKAIKQMTNIDVCKLEYELIQNLTSHEKKYFTYDNTVILKADVNKLIFKYLKVCLRMKVEQNKCKIIAFFDYDLTYKSFNTIFLSVLKFSCGKISDSYCQKLSTYSP